MCKISKDVSRREPHLAVGWSVKLKYCLNLHKPNVHCNLNLRRFFIGD